MNHRPTISVLMSVYNGEAFLAAAVDSILAQTYSDFEFIIINDGSTDSSADILARYTDPRIRLITQPNSGLIFALNRGIGLARGRYIARMDADDMAMPDRLARQFAYLEEHPEIGVLGGFIRIINAQGELVRNSAYPQGQREVSDFIINRGSPVAHPAVMMRTALVQQLGGYRKAYKHAEDYDLWLRVFECSRIDNLGEVVLQYRQHASNVSFKHALEQGVATAVARATHRLREAGRPDPSASLDRLDPATIAAQLGLDPDEQAQLNIEVLNVVHSSYVSTRNWSELDQLMNRLAALPVPSAARQVMAAVYIRTAALYVREHRLLPALRYGLTAFIWDWRGVARNIYAKIIGQLRILKSGLMVR